MEHFALEGPGSLGAINSLETVKLLYLRSINLKDLKRTRQQAKLNYIYSRDQIHSESEDR